MHTNTPSHRVELIPFCCGQTCQTFTGLPASPPRLLARQGADYWKRVRSIESLRGWITSAERVLGEYLRHWRSERDLAEVIEVGHGRGWSVRFSFHAGICIFRTSIGWVNSAFLPSYWSLLLLISPCFASVTPLCVHVTPSKNLCGKKPSEKLPHSSLNLPKPLLTVSKCD